jgi:hypothetical protein
MSDPAIDLLVAYGYKYNPEAGCWSKEGEKPAPVQEPVAYDKTEMNCFVQELYDKKMCEGKHGHYETMFHCVHQAIKRVTPPAVQKPWVGLTDKERNQLWRDVVKWGDPSHDDVDLMKAIEDKLKEKNT